MGDLVDNVAEQFTTAELVIIAEKLGLAPTSRWGPRKLIDVINIRLKKQGVPNPPADEDDMTRPEALMEDFVYLMGYIDEDGNVVDTTKGVKYDDVEDFMEAEGATKLPDCYTYADDKDPACARCKYYLYCAEERVAGLPPCYGLLWSKDHPECSKCLEQPFCKDVLISQNGKEAING